jgi:hypothetical protein
MTFRGVSGMFGPWYYYLYIFAMKTNLAMLALAALSLVRKDVWKSSVFLGLLLLIVLSIRSKIHGGPRYYLMVYVFAFSMCGAAVAWLLSRARGVRIARAMAVALEAAALWLTARSMPELLTHTSPLWGGDSEGYRYADANYDWGQGLNRAFEAADELGLKPVVFLHTGDPYYGVPGDRVMIQIRDPVTDVEQMRGRYVVVGVHILYHSEISNPELATISRALLSVAPAVRLTVTSFYFDLRSPEQYARFLEAWERARNEAR